MESVEEVCDGPGSTACKEIDSLFFIQSFAANPDAATSAAYFRRRPAMGRKQCTMHPPSTELTSRRALSLWWRPFLFPRSPYRLSLLSSLLGLHAPPASCALLGLGPRLLGGGIVAVKRVLLNLEAEKPHARAHCVRPVFRRLVPYGKLVLPLHEQFACVSRISGRRRPRGH